MRLPFAAAWALALAGCGSGEPANSGTPHAATLPAADSPVGQLYIHKCGECHAAPSPSAHPAFEWPGVVARMQNYRIVKGKGPLSEVERAQILGYLEQYAGQQ